MNRNTCINCGKGLNKNQTKYCSRSCANIVTAKKLRKNIFVCRNCEKVYHAKAKDRNKYCSRKCAYEHKKAKPKTKQNPVCVVCDEDFEVRVTRKYCSDKCRKEKAKREARKYAVKKHTIKTVNCKECNELFVVYYGSKRRVFCSDRCLKKNTSRTGKAIRRARMKGVEYETIDPIEILNRDKWTCTICGIDTPRELRGTINDNAPELDHIIPIAMNGTHTKDNVQCACRKCNIEKADKGQMVLAL